MQSNRMKSSNATSYFAFFLLYYHMVSPILIPHFDTSAVDSWETKQKAGHTLAKRQGKAVEGTRVHIYRANSDVGPTTSALCDFQVWTGPPVNQKMRRPHEASKSCLGPQ